MANLIENPVYESGVYQLEEGDPVIGGTPGFNAGVPVAGWSNAQAQQLANRTAFLKNSAEQFEADLANADNPAKGVAIVGRTAACLAGVVDLQNQPKKPSSFALVKSYHADLDYGGDVFVYKPTALKSLHDGGKYISSTVPWDGSYAGLSGFLGGIGETDPSGSGCWVHQTEAVRLVDYGVVEGVTVDSSAAWAAGWKRALTDHKELQGPDFAIKVGTPYVVDGSITVFSSLKMRGTFGTTASNLGYIPDRCGTVVYTDGNTAIDAAFSDWRNENFQIRGVGFVDSSHFPADSPVAPGAPILIRKGRADGTAGRYISGNLLEDVACYGYASALECIGVVPESVANAYLLNYIGPTSLTRFHVSGCTRALHLVDCSMNHLWVSDSIWFSLDAAAIALTKTASGSGGNVNVTFNNQVFEGLRGILNTAGGLTGPGSPGAGLRRNTLVLNSCNREFTGRFGPAEPNGFYSGSPFGYAGNTDIIINGVWTEGVAYGETSLPVVDVDATLSSSVRMEAVIDAGGKVLTPESVNRRYEVYTIPAGGSVVKLVRGGGADSFLIEVSLLFAYGNYGHKKIIASGIANGSKYQEVTGASNAALTFTIDGGGVGDYLQIQINNASGFNIDVSADILNVLGAGVLLS